MRTLTSSLLAKQKSSLLDPIYKIVLTYGGSTYTYDRSRILDITHDEQSLSGQAVVYLNNSDNALTALDFKAYNAVISYGQITSAGEEYSAAAPLKVIAQKFNSSPGELDCVLILESIPGLMADDEASETYAPADTDTQTVKQLLIAVAGATLACFNHCTAYELVFDSEDGLINTFMPKSHFRIYENGKRLATFRRLLDYTGCAMRAEADGKIHIFVPQTTELSTWQSGHTYSLNDIVKPTSPNGYKYKCTVPGTSASSLLRDYKNTGDNSVENIYNYQHVVDPETTLLDTRILGQTLTASSSYALDHIKLKLYKDSGLTGTTTLKIYAVSGYTPTTVLGSITVNLSTLTTDTAGEWVTFQLSTALNLVSGTRYALVLGVDSGSDPKKYVHWRVDCNYSGSEKWMYKGLADPSWTFDTYEALMYELYSSSIEPIWPTTYGATVTDGTVTWQNNGCGDYKYSLAAGCHTFFNKAYQNRLVSPNYVTVKSYDGASPAYSGTATDPSYSTLQKRKQYRMKLQSSAQAQSIAEAIIIKAQLQAEGGSGSVPINAGQEVLDFVTVIDPRDGTTKSGNVGYIHRRVNIRKKLWEMTFGFGGWKSVQNLLNDLATNSDTGSAFDRLTAKNLYAENITADNIDLATIDQDDIQDGSEYARVKAVHIDSGGLKIDDACSYKTGYDPTTKMAGNATLDNIPNGTTYSRVKSTALSASGLILLDQVQIGDTYGLIAKTDISSGHVLLSSTVKSGNWYDESGVSIDATNGIIIYGPATAFRTRATKSGADQCYVGADGAICAGAGKVKLDASGISIDCSAMSYGLLAFKNINGGNTYEGGIYLGSTGNLVISADGAIYFSSDTHHYKVEHDPTESDDIANKNYVDTKFRTKNIFGQCRSTYDDSISTVKATGAEGGYLYDNPDYANATIFVPQDYSSASKVYMKVLSKITNAAANWDIALKKLHNGSMISSVTDTSSTYNVSTDYVKDIDVTTLWNSLAPAAGDEVVAQLMVGTTTHYVCFIGIELQYS